MEPVGRRQLAASNERALVFERLQGGWQKRRRKEPAKGAAAAAAKWGAVKRAADRYYSSEHVERVLLHDYRAGANWALFCMAKSGS